MSKGFPSPIEQNIYEIVKGSYLNKASGQFLPLLNVAQINDHTPLPVITPLTIQRRRTQDLETMYVDVIITIWDILPNVPEVEPEALQMMAIYKAASYENDLTNIIDFLVDPVNGFGGCYYDFEGEQVFIPRFNEEAFSTYSDYRNSSYKDKIIGSTVSFTLKGPTNCVECFNDFGQNIVDIFC